MTKAEAQLEPAVDTILQAGQLVDGRYRAEYLLGEGGMAAVWAGTNERTGKRVALKVILRSLATTRVAQGLFQREALAASLVNHPNVVTVFDVIEHEGMACIVMELLEGESLASYIARRGFLSVSEATTLLLPAMHGVAAAHAQGVIHRDLKPQNIFICIEPDGRVVTTKVLDFGISVIVEQGMEVSAELALTIGTPAYMSPEHIQGVADIDGRADVYGFGLLLYEALSGKMAFPGEPCPELFDRVLNKPAPPVMLQRPDLPPGLVRIIETAMAKERDRRYQDLSLMVKALENELMTPSPAPRRLTPQAGVPSAARDPLSGLPAPAVEGLFNREPSGQHQGTRVLFAFPLEDSKDSAPHGLRAGSKELAPASPRGPETVSAELRRLLRKTRSSGIGALSAARGRRGLVGAGFAVMLGFFAVWMPIRGAHSAHTLASIPAANARLSVRHSIVRPVFPDVVSTATVDRVAATGPLMTASPSTPAPPIVNHSRVALRERPQALRRESKGYSLAWASSSARGAGASAKSAEPRAGCLTKEDF